MVGQPDLADSVLTIKSGFGGNAIHLMEHHKSSSRSCWFFFFFSMVWMCVSGKCLWLFCLVFMLKLKYFTSPPTPSLLHLGWKLKRNCAEIIWTSYVTLYHEIFFFFFVEIFWWPLCVWKIKYPRWMKFGKQKKSSFKCIIYKPGLSSGTDFVPIVYICLKGKEEKQLAK